jgi:large subunit ribosomal protein L35
VARPVSVEPGQPNRLIALATALISFEETMPKLKTKSGAKKRFSVTATGKIKCKRAFTQHRLVSKRQSAKVRNRGTGLLNECDAEIVRCWLPYSRKKG